MVVLLSAMGEGDMGEGFMALEMRPDTTWAEMARMVQRAMLERS